MAQPPQPQRMAGSTPAPGSRPPRRPVPLWLLVAGVGLAFQLASFALAMAWTSY